MLKKNYPEDISINSYQQEVVTESNTTTATNKIGCDTLFHGDIYCYQNKKGYRFSIDAVLLAHFANIKKDDRILDLGTGCGVIGLILLYRYGVAIHKFCGIECQAGLAEVARKNLQKNGFEEQGKIIQGDVTRIKELLHAESYNKIICNPPFYSGGSGRTNISEEVRLARHQILANLQDFLKASAFALKNRNSAYFIYPAERLCEFVFWANNLNLEVKSLQFVYKYPQDSGPASLVLIHCIKNGGSGVEIQPPFYVYSKKNGGFSPEMQNLYAKNSDYRSLRRR